MGTESGSESLVFQGEVGGESQHRAGQVFRYFWILITYVYYRYPSFERIRFFFMPGKTRGAPPPPPPPLSGYRVPVMKVERVLSSKVKYDATHINTATYYLENTFTPVERDPAGKLTTKEDAESKYVSGFDPL